MTEQTTTRSEKTRSRRPQAEADALRLLARAAALGGESLASIRARLQIPEPTLTAWARQDGYRQADLKAREDARKEQEAARGEGAEEIEAVRQQADELWEMCEEMQDRPSTGARRQVDLARARTLALAEAGFLDAAEEEMAAIRRLARLLSFGRAGSGEMERFQNQAAVIVRQKGLERAMEYARRINEEAEAERAARDAAGLPPLPPPEPRPWSKDEADAFYAELREKDRNRDYWSELAEIRRREREEGRLIDP
ncbi:hypothetical protein [Hyphomonas sp.]|uniref:hypothetical protein n=1 Tax=Hyphomonas sp. TaxID=87 RepID=UPI0035293FF3